MFMYATLYIGLHKKLLKVPLRKKTYLYEFDKRQTLSHRHIVKEFHKEFHNFHNEDFSLYNVKSNVRIRGSWKKRINWLKYKGWYGFKNILLSNIQLYSMHLATENFRWSTNWLTFHIDIRERAALSQRNRFSNDTMTLTLLSCSQRLIWT